MPELPDPIQALVAAARRAQILDAATTVFAHTGFHRATIKEIAKVARVADGTIYNYFANKHDLLLGLLHRLNETEQRPEHFADLGTADFAVFFRAYLRRRMAVLWDNTDLFRAVLPEVLAHPELRARYYGEVVAPTLAIAERYLGALVERGEIRALDVSLTARVLAGAPLGLLTLHLLGDEPPAEHRDELVEMLAALLLDGLRPPPSGDDAR